MKNPKPIASVVRSAAAETQRIASEVTERTLETLWLERRRMAARNGVFTRSRVHTRPEVERMGTFYGVHPDKDMSAELVPLASLPAHQQQPTLDWATRLGGQIPTNVYVWRFREDFDPETVNG
jgi:hypothetical protein